MSEMPTEIWVHTIWNGRMAELRATVGPVAGKECAKYIRADVAQEATYNAMDSVAADFEQAAPQLSDEDAQILEIMKFVVDGSVELSMWGDVVNRKVIFKDNETGWSGRAGPMLTKLRSRLKPVKPTADEWYEAHLGTIGDMNEVAARHEAAEEWEAKRNE